MFGKYEELIYWSTYSCKLKGDLPPSVAFVGTQGTHFEFYVQDEQLELLADEHCNRDTFQSYQRLTNIRSPLGAALVREYDRYKRNYCDVRNPVTGEIDLEKLYGPGDRDPNGFLKVGQELFIDANSQRYLMNQPVEGMKDLWQHVPSPPEWWYREEQNFDEYAAPAWVGGDFAF